MSSLLMIDAVEFLSFTWYCMYIETPSTVNRSDSDRYIRIEVIVAYSYRKIWKNRVIQIG